MEIRYKKFLFIKISFIVVYLYDFDSYPLFVKIFFPIKYNIWDFNILVFRSLVSQNGISFNQLFLFISYNQFSKKLEINNH